MTRLLLFILLWGLSLNVSSQNGFEVKENPVEATFDANTQDPVGKAEVTNTSNDSIFLYWKFEMIKGPDAWSPYFCDKNACYGPFLTECPLEKPVRLGVGDVSNLDLHITPNGVFSCGMLSVTVWEVGNPDNQVVVPYNFNCSVSSDDIVLENLQVFPNPAQHYFQVNEFVSDAYITVSNLLGNTVLNYPLVENQVYPVDHLPQGMYMVNIHSNADGILKTVRLQKN